jgi:DNA polymerase-3 subunit gamma/tau
MYQIALLARSDLPLAPDDYAGFTMAHLRMLTFAGGEKAPRVSAPRKAAAPGPSGAPRESAPTPSEPKAAQVAFDGDWPAFVAKLNPTGMAGMVARHGELVSFENGRLELVVPEAHRAFAERAYTDKLQAELAQVFGPGFRLTVRVGATSGASVASIRSRESEQRLESAAEAIESDPFVRELVRDFGAEVVASSIKPADEGRDIPSGRKG